MIWSDQRNEKQCKEIHEKAGGIDGLLKLTKNRMLVGFTGGKIIWFKENEPDLFRTTKIILLPKDYVRFRLDGNYSTDLSDASGTGLLDVKNREWSIPLLNKLNIPVEILPKCYESNEIVGHITKDASEETGLPEGLPVICGGGDAIIAMTGLGIMKEGEFGISLGTGGVIATALDEAYENPDGLLQISVNNFPGKWHVMGVTMGAGGAYRWMKEIIGDLESATANLTGESPYDYLNKEAEMTDPGAGGLLFLPHLFGSRCPYDDASSRGAFIGLTFMHNKGHLLRSVLEGVAFSFKEMSSVIGRMGVTPKQIRISGGGARSLLWRQIMADVFECDIVTVSSSIYGGAYGAALLAGISTGVWHNMDEMFSCIKIESRVHPIDDNIDRYEKLFSLYKTIYPQLKDTFHELW
jgi:xylulokinase